MINQYKGQYLYNKQSIDINAPNLWGIYYCGHLKQDGSLIPDYIGRATGEDITIKSRLLDHLTGDIWSEVTHFGFVVCSEAREAKQLETAEIAKFDPKYNKRIG